LLFEPSYHPGQRALAQVHGLGQLLDTELVLRVLREAGALLIAARLIKGMAAAFTAPAGLSIITTTFAESPARNRALSIYSAFGAGGFSLGLVLSGLLTEISWRWTLLLPAPVAAVILVTGLRLIPRQDAKDHPAIVSRGQAGSGAHVRPGARRPARRGFDLLASTSRYPQPIQSGDAMAVMPPWSATCTAAIATASSAPTSRTANSGAAPRSPLSSELVRSAAVCCVTDALPCRCPAAGPLQADGTRRPRGSASGLVVGSEHAHMNGLPGAAVIAPADGQIPREQVCTKARPVRAAGRR
jgi:MFS family permease